MKNSNDSYRVTNCRSGELHTDQTIELEESIKNKLIAQKQLKRRMFEVGQDIANIEYVVKKCQEEADTINAYIEGIEMIFSCRRSQGSSRNYFWSPEMVLLKTIAQI